MSAEQSKAPKVQRGRYEASIDALISMVTNIGGPLFTEGPAAFEAYLRTLSREKRHSTNVLRRIAEGYRKFKEMNKCIYCWYPLDACWCATIPRTPMQVQWTPGQTEGTNGRNEECKNPESRNQLVHSTTRTVGFDVVLVLHAVELWRQSNTGHILCMVLDLPVLVWGVPEHDQVLGTLDPRTSWILFPDDSSISIKDGIDRFLHSSYSDEEFQGVAETRVSTAPLDGKSDEDGTGEKTKAIATLPPANGEKRALQDNKIPLTMYVADSTWHQAGRVNKHIPSTVPRVLLNIPEDFRSNFAVRKQTRDVGVSTLEAVVLSLNEVSAAFQHRGLGLKLKADEKSPSTRPSHDVGSGGMEEVLPKTCSQLEIVMKKHVDRVLRSKHSDALYLDAWDEDEFAEYHSALHQHFDERRKLAEAKAQPLVSPEEVRARLPPPVTNMCGVCDVYVGWWRMEEHLASKRHLLAENDQKSKATTSKQRRAVHRSLQQQDVEKA